MDFKLQIYRDGEEHLLVDIDLNTIFSHVIMGEHLVRSTFTTPTVVDVREGDYIVKGIEQFTINSVDVPVSKDNGKTFTYNIEFEGYIYDLRDKAFTHLGALEFSLYIKPIGLVQNVVDCMNMNGSGWTVGVVDDLPEQNIEFYAEGKGYTCKEAMIKGADLWKLEFWLIGKQVNFTKRAGVDTTLVFEHGRGKGLYEIERGKLDQAYFNRLYVNGGTKNIPHTYRSGFKRLRLDEPYLELPLTGGKKRREGTVVLDDIYPRRTGTITAVSDDNLELIDTSIDFDLEGQRIEGETALIKFTTGENAGRSFEIQTYKHDTKKIIINPLVEADGYTYPNPTYEIHVGDKYVFLGIIMPPVYVTAAETELRVEGLKILNTAANTKLPYYVFLDQKFLRDNNVTINIGDRVRIVDEDLGANEMIRTSGIRYPWVNPNLKDLTISEQVPLHISDITTINIKKTENKVVSTTKVIYETARQATKSLNKLAERVFDPDGTLAGGPATLRAAMAVFGFDSTNFGLVGVTTTTNVGADPNRLTISAGQLMHNVYEITGLGFVWAMSDADFTDLDPLKFYYVYAKCSKTSLVGTWEISETPVKVSDFNGYWAFNTGQLSEVNEDNWRPFNFTKGVTWIIGNQIFTGRIQDITKRNFLDLDTGQFNLGDEFFGLDWDITNPNRLTLRGAVVQNAGGHTSEIGVFRGLYNNTAVYYTGDSVNYAGSVWRYIYPTPIFNVTPVEGDYWTVYVAAGATGATGATGAAGAGVVPRGQFDMDKTYVGSSIRVDAVLFGELWYFAKDNAGEFTGVLPTDDSKWLPAGAQFESIATGLLLAESAYIANLIAGSLRTSVDGKRVEIFGDNISMIGLDNMKYFEVDDDSVLTDDFYCIEIDANVNNIFFWGANRYNDYSAYNVGSWNYLTGDVCDFTDGFPRGYTGNKQFVAGTVWRYYFRKTGFGVKIGSPDDDYYQFSQTFLTRNGITTDNLTTRGAVASTIKKLTVDYTIDSDNGNMLTGAADHTLYYRGSANIQVDFPLLDGTAPTDVSILKNMVLGREIKIINKGTGSITASTTKGNYLVAGAGAAVATYVVASNETRVFRLVSPDDNPLTINNYYWLME